MQVLILMGVSGVGKTTIGKILSEKIQLPFHDADDFHPAENIRKMKNGIALLDEDRLAWLEVLALKIREWEKTSGAILACSALKEGYREHLQSYAEKKLTWLFLHADYDIVLGRLKGRKNHYFKPELLLTQYEALQEPGYGIHVDVSPTIEEVVSDILKKLQEQKSYAEIGLVGLGVMGKSLALNFAEKGIKVSVYNRQVAEVEVDVAKIFSDAHSEEFDLPWFDQLNPFLSSLKTPRCVFLMVNAGKAVDAVIESLEPFLEPGDLIIDGGNSHYKDTIRREKALKEKKFLFMGVGISGGEEGAKKGPSIMPGGSKPAYELARGFLEKIAAKDKDGNPCSTYVGPDGAGHFVKMLHNGIEYGEMQLIAECYHYLRFFREKSPEDIAGIFKGWNGIMKSYLLEITIDILSRRENGDYLIDHILDAAKQKGTGGWSTVAALELGAPFDTITASVMARNSSAKKEERVAASKMYERDFEKLHPRMDPEDLFKAYRGGSIINHAIGFDLLLEASIAYDWNLNLSEIARVWTNGCIIRSGFMEELVGLFKIAPSKNILLHPEIGKELQEMKASMLNTLAGALLMGCPMQVLSAAANYFLSYSSSQSSANMIQAQRDYFGAHTYERIDKPRGEFFHTVWIEKEK